MLFVLKGERFFDIISGCSIPVVRLFWEQIDWVRFPAPRHCGISLVVKLQFSKLLSGVRFAYPAQKT